MIPNEREEMLARYASGDLSPAEEFELMRAALADQELFEALGIEHSLREVMEDEECLRIALGVVARPQRSRLSTWLVKPAAWSMVGAAAAVVIAVALIGVRRPQAPVIEPTVKSIVAGREGILTDRELARISELMRRAPDSGLTIRFPQGPSFAMNGQLDVAVTSARPAALLALEVVPGEPARVIFPFPPAANARIAAGQEVAPPAAAARIEGLPGSREIWLTTFPPDTPVSDCLKGSTPWPEALAAHKATFLVRSQ